VLGVVTSRLPAPVGPVATQAIQQIASTLDAIAPLRPLK
jgi:hypothetical protein